MRKFLLFSLILFCFGIMSLAYSEIDKGHSKVSKTKFDVSFEELGVFKNPKNQPLYVEVYIYSPANKQKDLQKIIDLYKKRYRTATAALMVFIFNDRDKGRIGGLWLGGNNMSDETYSAEIIHYIRNSKMERYVPGPAKGWN